MKDVIKSTIGVIAVAVLLGFAWFGNLFQVIENNFIIFVLVIGVVFTIKHLKKTHDHEEGWTYGTRFANKAHREIFRKDRIRSRKWHAEHRK